jgi:hypothetical protein
VQPVVELVGGEEAAFVEQFADGGKVGVGDGISGIRGSAAFTVLATDAGQKYSQEDAWRRMSHDPGL